MNDSYKTFNCKFEMEQKIVMSKVLITCFKSNVASANTIIKNGGFLENKVFENGKIKQRYWIEI